MIGGFWGKIIGVILIPLIVYYCNKPSKTETPPPKIHMQPSGSNTESMESKVNQLISNGHTSILDQDSIRILDSLNEIKKRNQN